MTVGDGGQADARDRVRRPVACASASVAGADIGADTDVVGIAMRANGRMIWKVRPTPASQSSCGLRPTMSRPSSSTSPRIRPQESVQQVEQRGLARAVRADDAEDLVPRSTVKLTS